MAERNHLTLLPYKGLIRDSKFEHLLFITNGIETVK